MVITLWFIWTERNTIREEGRRRSPEAIARCIEYHMKMPTCMQGSRYMLSGLNRNGPSHLICVLKLNCDGSFLPKGRSGSWGFLIRDSDGDVITAGRGKIDHHLLNAFQADLIACLQGLQVAANFGMSRVLMETDAFDP